ncbi:MBL fold metallo-hydrolase [Luedemannella helvata]|uniref:MBL fold metallo-hydrolase n=2 Tax=Luedemannella helvata TaxID=349315 RepID=A0ABN2JT15_9ACTN
MRLMERVHLVGSGWLGYSLSDRHDSHVYLVDAGPASFLVDAGSGLATDAIVERVEAAGAPPVTHILLTHAHADHAAGAGELAGRLGAQLWAAAPVARMLAAADEVATGLAVARSVGTYPPSLRLRPITVDRTLATETITIGEVTVQAVDTPGHADGHLCYLVEFGGHRVLFTGDLVFARGRVAVLADADLGLLRASLERVAALRPTVLLPGHGSVAVTGAAEHLAVATRAFANGHLPPGLLP